MLQKTFPRESSQLALWRYNAVTLAAVFAVAPLVLQGQTPPSHHDASSQNEKVGRVSFQVSCAQGVRSDFDRAVALLHHMMYVESRGAFEEIAAKDPQCAMAHWGIAMTLFQPLWPARPGREQLQRAWEEVETAKRLSPDTDRDRALLAAAEAFYREPDSAEWWTRIRRWADAMQVAYRQHPEDAETAAFFALSQLAVAPVSEDRMTVHGTAANVLLRLHEKQPTHPGAIHYIIHANDVSGRAAQSLDIVRSYDEIAPSVPHALHMPTHIFVRLGDWPAVMEWNRKAADAALRFPAGDRISLHYVHAMDYLLYAHLQRGEDARAQSVLEEATQRAEHQEDFVSAFHLAAMPARYAVERRAWKEAAAVEPRAPAYLAWDRYGWAESISWLARGLGAARTGDLAGAWEAEARMRQLRDRAEQAKERDFARYIEVDRLVLEGFLSKAQGNNGDAVTRMRAAAVLEQNVQKHPVSPGAVLPPYEALGDLLAELGRHQEARVAYDSSLSAWPLRYHSLLGAARAARAVGEVGMAREYYARLLGVVGDAETTRPGVSEARDFLSRNR
ncbi:MAG TPA: hypothetical protein VJ596_11935 [Gemmatimonadaceae bacterium]|nr:hypothetical protein [Gemmatimonadaceae bacterium]